MAKVFYRKIKAGDMQLSDVPAFWYAATKALLDADNGGIE